MNPTIRISKLLPADWQKYKDLRLEALREDSLAFGASYAEASKHDDNHWQKRLENSENIILVAWDNGKAIAMAAAYREEGEKVSHIAYIWGVYVGAIYRGQGIGKKLLKDLLKEIDEIGGIEKINLNVNTTQQSAVQLYENVGFKIIGTLHKELKIDGEYFDEHIMEKLLK